MSYTIFKQLHQENQLLVLGNVWDAQSAKIAQDAGFKALGSSSHAIANLLGYEDGEQISVDELLFMVERIVKAVDIPVSVDFEAGYSDDPDTVAKHVQQLADLGVIGINLEDGEVINGERKLQDALLLANKIKAIKATTSEMFINARADTYTTKHPQALEESIKRATLYEEAGADGLFIPLVETKEDIQKIVSSTQLPLNIFLTDNLPDLSTLNQWGVRRLSHGAKIYEWLVEKNKDVFQYFVNDPRLPKS
ncbi:isocitrate lyase/PEP mutase family protein [Sphingobacterium chuzhouense]|uniref:Isocitrate lyase/phosphoenolpyruvate mutase family protein n=1 Tax=Sphingobacterium chuzhouense TaxID=1742264 RepID=A0ABR7XSE3_9SPHI|nr:isocitrate lyase/phosphoenolpyruvate mutase family protein [Sphingobacterium chuzhouense]MBD1422098.1 isocitrate lyase/phosphoenolpyruvate mutase family protein [Sphingobacterium chuzhouense]